MALFLRRLEALITPLSETKILLFVLEDESRSKSKVEGLLKVLLNV
jgi:hypothetical protein